MQINPSVTPEPLQEAKEIARLCEDVYFGYKNVINQTYLPKLNREDDTDYEYRKRNTEFTNYTALLIDTIKNIVLKNKIVIKNSKIELSSVNNFASELAKLSLISGISFIVIHTDENGAYAEIKKYSDLISYKKIDKNEQFVFRDSVEIEDSKNPFLAVTKERYVVYKPYGGEVWVYNDKTNRYEVAETWQNNLEVPAVIPVIIGKKIKGMQVISPVLDISKLNLIHMNRNSLLSNLIGVVSVPIPVIYGQIGNEDIKVGVSSALHFTDKSTEGFEYVSANASSIAEVSRQIKELETKIDTLSFSLLTKSYTNTIEDAKQNTIKSSSAMYALANTLQETIRMALELMHRLENKEISKELEVSVNKDFTTAIIDIKTAYNLLLAGEMSRETFYAFIETGRLPDGFNAKEESERIAAERVL